MKKLLFLLALFAFGCQSEPNYQDHELLGDWQATEWKDITNEKIIDISVRFRFEKDNRYIGQYDRASEKGKYWIEGEHLHTIEDGKAEKKVKIKKLQNDTLILGMNRMGSLEEITLLKAK